jgi:type IV secretion system protein VirB4
VLDILGILNKKSQAQGEFTAPQRDFIPYACHYDKDTVLTRSGHLLQTICIKEFAAVSQLEANVRDNINKLLSQHIQSNKFALYFHTVRKRKNLDTSTQPSPAFAQGLHKNWVKQNEWNNRFVNDMYITVIRGGSSIKTGYKDAARLFFMNRVVENHTRALEQGAQELRSTVDSVLKSLADSGATRLSLKYSDKDEYSSELLQFFAYILRLETKDISLPTSDLAEHLTAYRLMFGQSTLKFANSEREYYASILSLKRFDSLSQHAIDKLLQFNAQFIISSAVTFVPIVEALKFTEYQRYMLTISKDKVFEGESGIDPYFHPKQEYRETSFCTAQTTIMLVESSQEALEKLTIRMNSLLNDVGIPAIREDLNLEHSYWSQLPCNFSFIARNEIMPFTNVGNFVSFGQCAFGSLTNKWGEYVALLSTALNSPYFFNFHINSNGHTILIGDNEEVKTTLLNYLVAESLKFQPKVLYLDFNRSAEFFIKALGGGYKVVSLEADSVKLNPLLLEDSQENRDFLKYWFMFLLDKYSDPTEIDLYLKAAEAAINKIFSSPKEERKLDNVAKFFTEKEFAKVNKLIITALAQWYGTGKLAHVFNHDIDELQGSEQQVAFGIDLTDLHDTPISMSMPILSYLLHYFRRKYTGSDPSVLVIADSNKTLSNTYFEKNLSYILSDLEKLNSIVLMKASFNSTKVNWSATIAQIYNQYVATKIFMQDSGMHENIGSLFTFSNEDRMYLQALDSGARFLLKQGTVSVLINNPDFSQMDESKILYCRKPHVKILQQLATDPGTDPTIWLQKFYETTRAEE